MRGFLRRLGAKLFSPVPQNPRAIILGNYGTAIVQLRPVMDSDHVITEWVPDPDSVALLDAARAREAAAAVAPTTPEPPNVPGGPTLPAGFNPAGVAGL